MKLSKKFISAALALTIALSLVTPAMAQDIPATPYCKATPYANIYESSNGEYTLIENGTVQEVDVLEFDSNNNLELATVLTDENIPQEVRDALEDEYYCAMNSAEDAVVVLITPKSQAAAMADPMQPPATKYATTTYKGVQMQSWRLVTTTKSTPFKTIKSGKDTYAWASNTTNIALAVAGLTASGGTASVVIGLCGLGKALIDVAVWDYDEHVIQGNTQDYAELKIIYKDTQQWTYSWINNDWVLSLCTERVDVKKTETIMNYYVPSIDDWVTGTVTNASSQTFQSYNFDSQWQKAYECGPYAETQWLIGRYNGATFNFK